MSLRSGKVELRSLSVFKIALLCSLIMPTDVLAQPIAHWLTTWTVDFGGLEIGDGGRAQAFGRTATKNEQVKDIGDFGEPLPQFGKPLPQGTPAVAKAEVHVDPDLRVRSNFNSRVNFERRFRLPRTRAGWDVQLITLLMGTLDTANRRLDPSATVFFSVDIFPFTVLLPTGISISGRSSVDDGDDETIAFSRFDEGFLADGDYIVRGSLSTVAAINRTVFRRGSAEADFFTNREPGFLLANVFATPRKVPVAEPSTLALFGIGAVGLLGYLQRRKQVA